MKFTVTQEDIGEDSSTVFVAVGHNGFRVLAAVGITKDEARDNLWNRIGPAQISVFRITLDKGKEQK